MEKDIADTEDIPFVVVTSTDIVSNIKGYIPAVVNKVETWLNMSVSMSTIVLYDG